MVFIVRYQSMQKLFFSFLLFSCFEKIHSQSVALDGSLQYKIAIEIPRAKGPMPQLSISYNSNNPNGILGAGFILDGFPVITRGNNGNGVQYNGHDTFIGAAGRMILKSGTNDNPRIYLPQNYNGSRYLAYGTCGDGPCYWIEETASGARQYFGQSDGRSYANTNAGVNGSIREWGLSKVEDSDGRYYEIEYENHEGQQYPSCIRYSKGPGLENAHVISFVYDKTGRSDIETSFSQTAKVRTQWRLHQILIETEQPILWGLISWESLVKSYTIFYSNNSFISKIENIQSYYSDGTTEKTIRFDWMASSGAVGSHNVSDPGYQDFRTMADVNGDGKDDYCRRVGDGATWISCAISGTNGFNGGSWDVSDPGYQDFHTMADVNGDGKADFCRRVGDGSWISCALSPIVSMPPLSKITEIKSGISHFFSYILLSNISSTASITCSDNSPAGYGQPCGTPFAASRYIVSNVKSYAPMGTGGSNQLIADISYSYENAHFFNGFIKERTLLGFGKIVQTDNLRNRRTETKYRQDRRFAGLLLEQKAYNAESLVSVAMQDAPSQYRCDDNGCVADNTLILEQPRQVRPGKLTITEYDSSSVITITREIAAYDDFGNPAEFLEIISGNGNTKTKRTITDYINRISEPRRIGLGYHQKECINNCSDDNIKNEFYLYFDNAPEGELGSKGKITQRVNVKAGIAVGEKYSYDSDGFISDITYESGIQESYEYDSFGHIKKTILRAAGSTTIREQKIDPRFGTIVWGKDENNIEVFNKLDLNGRVTEQRTMTDGKLLKKVTHSYQIDFIPNHITQCSYYALPGQDDLTESSCTRIFTDTLGQTILNVTSSPSGAFQSVKTEYDSYGRIYRESEPYASDNNGNGTPQKWTVNQYDNRDRIKSKITSDGKFTIIEYNKSLVFGSIASEHVTFPDGSTKQTWFNLDKQPVRIIENNLHVDYSYDATGLLVQVSTPQGMTFLQYDAWGRQTAILDPHAGTTRYEYYNNPADVRFGKVRKETRKSAGISGGDQETVYDYDALGRLKKIQREDSVTSYHYDESEVEFGKGRVTTVEHSMDISSATDSAQLTITDSFRYHFNGEKELTIRHITGDTDGICTDKNEFPCKIVYGQKYNAVNQVTEQWYPDETKSIIHYNPAALPSKIEHEGITYATFENFNLKGQVLGLRYGNGVKTSYTYGENNSLERATTRKEENSLLDMSYSYDNVYNITCVVNHTIANLSTNFKYDSMGRLQKASRINNNLEYTFNEAGNILQNGQRKLLYVQGKITPFADQKWNATSSTWIHRNDYTWSEAGNLHKKQNANGSLDFWYNSNHMLRKVKETSEQSDTNGSETLFFYDYQGERFLKIYKRPQKPAIHTWYMGDGYELREKWYNNERLALQGTKYIYGLDGKKITSITENVKNIALLKTNQNRSLAFLIGSFSLKNWKKNMEKTWYMGNYAAGLIIFVDKICGICLLIFLGILIVWLSFRLTVQAEHHDNRISLGWKITALPTLAFFFNLSMVSCTYDLLGDRIVIFVPDGISASFDSIYDGLPVGTYYYTHDHQGSGSLVTDEAGEEVLRITYDPYGNVDLEHSGIHKDGQFSRAANDAGFALLAVRFTGQDFDPETGLYYYNARYYDPSLGMFTTPDNLVPFEGGNMNLTAHPQQNFDTKKAKGQTTVLDYHRYMYVRGNPVKYTDPSGHESHDPWDISKWSFSTTPFWHNWTGLSHRGGEPVTVLDGISKGHDSPDNGGFHAFFKEGTIETRSGGIKNDKKFIYDYYDNFIKHHPRTWGDNVSKAQKYLDHNAWGKTGSWIGGVVLGTFYQITDFIYGAIGVSVFSLNIAGNALARSYQKAVSSGRFKNWNKPKKWKLR